MKIHYFITLFIASLLAGCAANNNQYYWGQYENLIYKTYQSPGELTSDAQIDILQTDIEMAEAEGKPIPPGIYAHLGLIHAASGHKDLALAALTKEKELYPESVTFIDGLISRSLTTIQGADNVKK